MASVFCLIIAAAAPAAAQTPAPSAAPAPAAPAAAPAPAPAPAPATAPPAAPAAAPPPPGYAYPPPPYGYPPPGYPMYPAPQLRQPESVPYNGGPVPHGYHVEERPRRGLIIGGALTLGVPWALGIVVASGYDFSNQSGWLVVPVLGPWITMASRKTDGLCGYGNSCPDDNGVRTMLILDGLTQAAGALMLIYGLSSTKKVMARDFVGSLHLTPAQVGKFGYGGVLSGQF